LLDKKKAVKKSVGQVGNHKFLQGVQWCIEQRVRIFGLHAPKQIDVNWRAEAQAQGIDADTIYEHAVDAYVEALTAGAEPAEFQSVPGSEAPRQLLRPESDVDPASGAADISD
jgi:hypothetical protein